MKVSAVLATVFACLCAALPIAEDDGFRPRPSRVDNFPPRHSSSHDDIYWVAGGEHEHEAHETETPVSIPIAQSDADAVPSGEISRSNPCMPRRPTWIGIWLVPPHCDEIITKTSSSLEAAAHATETAAPTASVSTAQEKPDSAPPTETSARALCVPLGGSWIARAFYPPCDDLRTESINLDNTTLQARSYTDRITPDDPIYYLVNDDTQGPAYDELETCCNKALGCTDVSMAATRGPEWLNNMAACYKDQSECPPFTPNQLHTCLISAGGTDVPPAPTPTEPEVPESSHPPGDTSDFGPSWGELHPTPHVPGFHQFFTEHISPFLEFLFKDHHPAGWMTNNPNRHEGGGWLSYDPAEYDPWEEPPM